jgi:aminopeptidase C
MDQGNVLDCTGCRNTQVLFMLLTANDYYLQYEIIIGVFNRYGTGPNSTMAVIYSAEGSKSLIIQ